MHDLYGPLPLARWQELGVRLPGGGALPSSDMAASVLMTGGSAFLVYQNYEALLAYNCAHPYALGLGLLSDQIASASPRT
jgi:membrane-bound lytic murein transglycosylase B